MAGHREPFRKQSKIAAGDPAFSVRLASISDLQWILQEANEYRWSAVWTSEEALVRQVDSGSMAILCPLFRNGGPIDEPNSYRCHLWFVKKGDVKHSTVSLLDVGERSLLSLRDVSEPAQLKSIVRVLLDGAEYVFSLGDGGLRAAWTLRMA